MQKIKFTVEIRAPKERVWQILWNDKTYRLWTAAFCPGSHYAGNLSEGSRIHFLDPQGDGMYSDVAELTENEFVSFKHLGEIKNRVELPNDENSEKWSGGYEEYSLDENDGLTSLSVAVDAVEEHLDFFDEKFPIALAHVKKLSENRAVTLG